MANIDQHLFYHQSNTAKKTGLVICSPISTSIRGGLTEVIIDNLDQPSVVASAIVNTLSFKDRKAKLIIKADKHVIRPCKLKRVNTSIKNQT